MEEKRGEIAWNIVAEQTKFIGQLLQQATQNYLRGNIKAWFEVLTAIRENINYDLKNKEPETLDSAEKNIWSLQKYWNRHLRDVKNNKITSKQLKVKKQEYVDAVRAYSRNLMGILNTLGYFPKKEDRTKLSF